MRSCRGRSLPPTPGLSAGRLGGLPHHHVAIRAAKTEGADPGDPWPARRSPRGRFGGNEQRRSVQRDVGVEPLKVQVRRDLALLQRQNHLEQSGDSGRRLQVPHVRLDGAQPTRPIRRTVFAEHRTQSPHLDGIAQRGAGAVGFDEADIRGCQARVVQGLPNHPLLRRTVGRGQAVASIRPG